MRVLIFEWDTLLPNIGFLPVSWSLRAIGRRGKSARGSRGRGPAPARVRTGAEPMNLRTRGAEANR